MSDLTALLRRIPKVEIHCHLLGTIRKQTMKDIAARNGARTTADEIERFYVRGEKPVGVLHIFRELEGHILQSPEDLRQITYEYLEDVAVHTVRHAEIFWNPTGTLRHTDLSYRDLQAAILRGMGEAEREFGISSGLIPSIDREASPGEAVEMVRLTIDHREPGVLGIGIDYNEVDRPPEMFAEAYALAVSAGFKATAHAGEFGTPWNNVATALDLLRVDRIDHGYRRHNATGWHTTGTLGPYAAAAAVGKFLGLSAEQTVWALGIAGSFTGGTWAFNRDGAMSKRYHTGVAAELGLQACLLAREGFTGPVSVLEAERGGYFRLYGSGMTPEARRLTDGLGTDWRIRWAGVKVYACCRGIHSALDVVLDLRQRHRLTGGDIERITVLCTPVQNSQLGLTLPKTRIEAQFSLPYSVATAIIHGEAGYEFFTGKWIGNPGIEALAAKVTLKAIEDRSLEEEPELIVETGDGRVFRGQQKVALGDPANPVPEDAIRAKFRALSTGRLSPETADRLEDHVLSIDRPGSLAGIEDVLGTPAEGLAS